MTKRKKNQDDAWGSDPVEDMENAIKILKQSTDYKMLGEIEKQVNLAIQLLIDDGKSPEEIEKILIKYGIWPNFPV